MAGAKYDECQNVQELASSSGAGRVNLGADVEALRLNRQLPLAELRRHKRAFLKLATQNVATRLQDRASARRLFADYLRESVD
jgi:protein KTI12